MSAAFNPFVTRPATLSDAEKIIEQLQQKLAIQRVESSGFGRAVTAATHREIWSGQREVVEPAVGDVRAGAGGQWSGSAGRE